jgi:diguanylate cyclase (GGDEF)-like protein/PAS domain S-box-containing protein
MRGPFVKFAANLFECVVKHSATPMVIVESTSLVGNGVYANTAFQELTGYTAADIRSYGLDILHGEETDPQGVAKLRTALSGGRELRLVLRSYCKNGSWFWNMLHAMPLRQQSGESTHSLIMSENVTAGRSVVEHLEQRAHHDQLTGLPNRYVLNDRLDEAISHAREHGGSFALVFVDVNHFKQINDFLGHDVGDELLRLVAARLAHCVRSHDTVSRVGGDEFVLLLPNMPTQFDVVSVRQRVSDALKRPVLLQGRRIEFSCSIGVSVYPTDGCDRASLFRSADIEMYRNKSARNPRPGGDLLKHDAPPQQNFIEGSTLLRASDPVPGSFSKASGTRTPAAVSES